MKNECNKKSREYKDYKENKRKQVKKERKERNERNERKENIEKNHNSQLYWTEDKDKVPQKEINLTALYKTKFNPVKLKYTFLKSSIFFFILWIGFAIFSLSLIKRPDIDFKTVPGFTLVLTSIYCLLSAFTCINRYFLPYLEMEKNYMKINNSLFNRAKIDYREIRGTTYKNEIVGLVTYSGKTYNVSLKGFSDEAGRIFLELLKNRMDLVRGVIKE